VWDDLAPGGIEASRMPLARLVGQPEQGEAFKTDFGRNSQPPRSKALAQLSHML
jgi:hypothetical protein